jgi:hypothetical protein
VVADEAIYLYIILCECILCVEYLAGRSARSYYYYCKERCRRSPSTPFFFFFRTDRPSCCCRCLQETRDRPTQPIKYTFIVIIYYNRIYNKRGSVVRGRCTHAIKINYIYIATPSTGIRDHWRAIKKTRIANVVGMYVMHFNTNILVIESGFKPYMWNMWRWVLDRDLKPDTRNFDTKFK